MNQLKQETQRLNKTRETIQRKLRQVEDNKSDLEFQRETLKGQILGLERGIYTAGVLFKSWDATKCATLKMA